MYTGAAGLKNWRRAAAIIAFRLVRILLQKLSIAMWWSVPGRMMSVIKVQKSGQSLDLMASSGSVIARGLAQ